MCIIFLFAGEAPEQNQRKRKKENVLGGLTMKMKKLMALVLAGMMTVSTAVPVIAAEDKNEYSVFAILNGEYDLADNLTMQTTLEEAGLKFDFTSVMGADLAEKRNLLLASGDYPEIFMKSSFTMTDLNKYGSQGLFLPLEDLIKEHAPNLTKVLDERDAWKYLTSADGHIYSLPEIGRQEGAVTTYWINKRWMDNLGLEEPKNLDELYNVLKAFKEQDANGNGDTDDEIPFTATDVVKPDLLLPYFDINYDYGTKDFLPLQRLLSSLKRIHYHQAVEYFHHEE